MEEKVLQRVRKVDLAAGALVVGVAVAVVAADGEHERAGLENAQTSKY